MPGVPAIRRPQSKSTPRCHRFRFPHSRQLGSTLTQNLSDLQPRNHLYVTAGAASLALTFPLDTTTLADGYHDLTAVAYEGT